MNFDEALDNFVLTVQVMIDDYYARNHPNLPRSTITAHHGRRYVKIVNSSDYRRYVYCFIDKNGDILKSASWNAPAKGARGNIYVPFADAINEYGAVYNR
jgi:hypothetical protein